MISPLAILGLAVSSGLCNRDHLGHNYDRDDGDYGGVILEQSYYIDTGTEQYYDVAYNEIADTPSEMGQLEVEELKLTLADPVEDNKLNLSSLSSEDYFDTESLDGNFTDIQLDDYYDYNATLDDIQELFQNETEDEIVVPVAEIISIAPVEFDESPLNVTFEAVGEVQLGDNTTVSLDSQDITVAVIQKVKVGFLLLKHDWIHF